MISHSNLALLFMPRFATSPPNSPSHKPIHNNIYPFLNIYNHSTLGIDKYGLEKYNTLFFCSLLK